MMALIAAIVFPLVWLTAPVSAHGQARPKMPHVGVLRAGTNPVRIEAFRAALRALGYEEGRNIAIELRAGPIERLDALAVELVRLNPDILVTDSAPATQAAKRATTTIPIVFGATADPIGAGFVKSLARPGGNITGFTEITPELSGKRLQLLKELVPGVSSIAVLGNPGHAFHQSMLRGIEDAARQLALKTRAFEARTREDIERAFAVMGRERPDAVVMLPHPLFGNHQALIAALGLKHRLPVSVTSSERVEAGGLFAYAPDYTEQFRRAATYVDKILKGAKPAELPVEQPTKFDLLINAKTARALGLELPQSLLLRADRVFQ